MGNKDSECKKIETGFFMESNKINQGKIILNFLNIIKVLDKLAKDMLGGEWVDLACGDYADILDYKNKFKADKYTGVDIKEVKNSQQEGIEYIQSDILDYLKPYPTTR